MSEHDPDALRRRLARYFDTVPHLAVVSVASASRWGYAALCFNTDLCTSTDVKVLVRAEREVERLLGRVGRLLGFGAIRSNDDSWGPRPNDRVIYVRDQHHQCWARWLARDEAARSCLAARSVSMRGA